MSLPIVYRYFGTYADSSHHSGIICVATQLDKDQRLLKLGASYCNPKDVFVKNKARTIAKGRLLKDSTCLIFNFTSSFEISHNNLNKLIVQLVSLLPRCPDSSWTKKLITQIKRNPHD